MTWIDLGAGVNVRARWHIDGFDQYAPNEGIGHNEWFNVHSGAGYLLAVNGNRRTGGWYRLFWKAPGSKDAEDMTSLLSGWSTEFTDEHSLHWTVVKEPLCRRVNALLEAVSIASLTHLGEEGEALDPRHRMVAEPSTG